MPLADYSTGVRSGVTLGKVSLHMGRKLLCKCLDLILWHQAIVHRHAHLTAFDDLDACHGSNRALVVHAVGCNHRWALTAQLQCDRYQIGRSSSHDLPAHRAASGVDKVVPSQGWEMTCKLKPSVDHGDLVLIKGFSTHLPQNLTALWRQI